MISTTYNVDGLAVVERQIADAVAMATWDAGGTPLPKDAAGDVKGQRKAVKGGKGGAGGGTDGPDWERFWEIVSRFTLIYPTDTAYDSKLGEIVRVEAMRLGFGRGWVNMWLESAKRRTVNLADVVFEPSGKVEAHQLNLFRPLEVQPSADASCAKLLELLQYLCGEADQDMAPITDWVLRWLAYPLQHLGAKMQTAVVMAGKEGAGKNLFFGAINEIYGCHGGLIGQRQLESQFQLWLSAKLFLIANEVVTRQEMHHNIGFLKQLITDNVIWINRKGRDERCEANHMNIVFFSNETQPMKVAPDDRRAMVIRTPAKRDKAYYAEVAAEMKAGGVAALYYHLLHLELEGFNEHTEPIMTEAKEQLIEIGMAAPQLFWQDLHDGSLGLPYCPSLVTDVYSAFYIWCQRNGHKMPQAINRFTPDFMSINGVTRGRVRVADPDRPRELLAVGEGANDSIKQRKIFFMGEPKADFAEENLRVRQGVAEFRSALKSYSREGRGYSGYGRQGEPEEEAA